VTYLRILPEDDPDIGRNMPQSPNKTGVNSEIRVARCMKFDHRREF
jgi:hypothetical protein